MMQVVRLKIQVNAEGKGILQFPQELANQELEIAIAYQTFSPITPTQTHEDLDGIAGF